MPLRIRERNQRNKNHQLERQTKWIVLEFTWILLTEENAIRTDDVNVKIYCSQKNSKCRLYVDRIEKANHIINQVMLLKGNCRFSWVGKMVHWELESWKVFEHQVDCHTNCSWYLWNDLQKEKRLGEQKISEIIKTIQKTLRLRSAIILWRILTVTQTPVKNIPVKIIIKKPSIW